MEQRSRTKQQFWQTANRLSLLACLLLSGVLNAQETAAKKAATKPEKQPAPDWDGTVDEDAYFDDDSDEDLPDWRLARRG